MTQDTELSAYLFIVPWNLKHVGGVNQVVTSLAAEMIRAGSFKPIFFIDDWDAPNPVWEKFGTIDVVRWRIRPLTSTMGMKQKIKYTLWKRRFAPKFKRFCQDHRISVINLHYPGPNAFSLVNVLSQDSPNVSVEAFGNIQSGRSEQGGLIGSGWDLHRERKDSGGVHAILVESALAYKLHEGLESSTLKLLFRRNRTGGRAQIASIRVLLLQIR